ncbi:NUCB2-like protein [Mya arenaria]|uniref:NUCB2-like protein n=1 Tax=Mya arenaria TaxID=6604 RepID=A0ABY7E0L6_MYAAR|nr:NUCB2-like protein [Mya arenaria]
MDNSFLHHLDTKNAHSFEAEDLEKLIKKATGDLDEIDKKRRGEFKTYEMEKEHLRREELKKLDEDQRKQKEHEFEELQKKHKEHKPVHHPGSKAQLEDVWEKTDNMDTQDFNPKTFFNMHDLDGNGFLDGEEVEALFQKELDEVYDPNNPEDDMREKYEDMGRMREHVFNEIDTDKDHLISQEEFLNYTNSNQFEKDEGWKTVDEEQNYTEEELERYEQMLREHEERARAQGIDPNQPGMVPLGHDPNVQEMQMPHEAGQMPMQGGQQAMGGQMPGRQDHVAMGQGWFSCGTGKSSSSSVSGGGGRGGIVSDGNGGRGGPSATHSNLDLDCMLPTLVVGEWAEPGPGVVPTSEALEAAASSWVLGLEEKNGRLLNAAQGWGHILLQNLIVAEVDRLIADLKKSRGFNEFQVMTPLMIKTLLLSFCVRFGVRGDLHDVKIESQGCLSDSDEVLTVVISS